MQDICERTFNYALKAITLFNECSKEKNGACNIISKQYLKSATSIGANIEEAQAGESRADFIHKYSIALKEARESMYWLRLLDESNLIRCTLLNNLINEADEIISILTSIIKKSKKNV